MCTFSQIPHQYYGPGSSQSLCSPASTCVVCVRVLVAHVWHLGGRLRHRALHPVNKGACRTSSHNTPPTPQHQTLHLGTARGACACVFGIRLGRCDEDVQLMLPRRRTGKRIGALCHAAAPAARPRPIPGVHHDLDHNHGRGRDRPPITRGLSSAGGARMCVLARCCAARDASARCCVGPLTRFALRPFFDHAPDAIQH